MLKEKVIFYLSRSQAEARMETSYNRWTYPRQIENRNVRGQKKNILDDITP